METTTQPQIAGWRPEVHLERLRAATDRLEVICRLPTHSARERAAKACDVAQATTEASRHLYAIASLGVTHFIDIETKETDG